MRKPSAGILTYRRRDGELEFLLVHPGGPYWEHRDDASWSIPKGEYEPAEQPLDDREPGRLDVHGRTERTVLVAVDGLQDRIALTQVGEVLGGGRNHQPGHPLLSRGEAA